MAQTLKNQKFTWYLWCLALFILPESETESAKKSSFFLSIYFLVKRYLTLEKNLFKTVTTKLQIFQKSSQLGISIPSLSFTHTHIYMCECEKILFCTFWIFNLFILMKDNTWMFLYSTNFHKMLVLKKKNHKSQFVMVVVPLMKVSESYVKVHGL